MKLNSSAIKALFTILCVGLGTAYSQTSCDKYSKKYTPKNLDDALEYFNCTWSQTDKEDFRIASEEDAVTRLHEGTGRAIRNEWSLWKGRNSLVKYFKSIGIFHPDDMSSIILTSFHRKLNGKEMNLDNQVQRYKTYWNKAKQQEL